MSSIKGIEYVGRAPIVSADEDPPVEHESLAPLATSLSGEWIPLPEAIAWIIFRDFGKARHLRKASHLPMSLECAFAQAGIDPTSPVMAPREAQVELMDALRQGAIPAMGCRYLGNGEIILLGPEQWAHLEFEDHAAVPWGAACRRTLAFFCDFLVNAKCLLETFPESIERTEDENVTKTSDITIAKESQKANQLTQLFVSNPNLTRSEAAVALGLNPRSRSFELRIWPHGRQAAGLPERGSAGRKSTRQNRRAN